MIKIPIKKIKIKKVKKRDGSIVNFDPSKIFNAIKKAFIATEEKDGKKIKEVTEQVIKNLEKRFPRKIPSVEDIQDIVEETLIKNGFARVAKAYILYRHERAQIRKAKKILGVKDDLKLSLNAIKVLKSRYLLKDKEGKYIIETPTQLFKRVAKAIAQADKLYKENSQRSEEEFFNLMKNLEFLPNSPTLMNAGTNLGQLSACFVLPVDDSIEEIFDALKYMAIIHKSGGGTGFSFSKLRPKGDLVRSTKGQASGPLSFMEIFDKATSVIKQGGKRRGANMGILNFNHPDILDFIKAKSDPNAFTNFNLSVAVTDEFMKRVLADLSYQLINPRTGKPTKEIKAKEVFDFIILNAWQTGDPGLVFIDEINRKNPLPALGKIEATNPCGEQPLLPYESCNLGSINLVKMIKFEKEKLEIDWNKLKKTIKVAVHFLDNVIDVNKYPLIQIEKITKANRKIGLGIMGWAELLAILGIPYNSKKALTLAKKLMKFITFEARKASVELAKKRGSFPNFEKSIWKSKFRFLRNASCTTIAPTGTISIIAGCSSGIEPFFAIAFSRVVLEGTRFLEVNNLFEVIAKSKGFYSEDLIREIAKTGSLANIEGIPPDIKKIFVTAFDIDPLDHVRMQAAFQKYTDNAVAKTVNLAPYATLEDVRNVYFTAWKLKCKGITIYRYGSKPAQVLSLGMLPGEEKIAIAESEYAGGCPVTYCPY